MSQRERSDSSNGQGTFQGPSGCPRADKVHNSTPQKHHDYLRKGEIMGYHMNTEVEQQNMLSRTHQWQDLPSCHMSTHTINSPQEKTLNISAGANSKGWITDGTVHIHGDRRLTCPSLVLSYLTILYNLRRQDKSTTNFIRVTRQSMASKWNKAFGAAHPTPPYVPHPARSPTATSKNHIRPFKTERATL